MNRRSFMQLMLAAGVAPFVVRAESLMPIKPTKILTAHDLLMESLDRVVNPPLVVERGFGLAAVASQPFTLKLQESHDGFKWKDIEDGAIGAFQLEPGTIYRADVDLKVRYLRHTIIAGVKK